jgi:SAM-dependent methyltransferase
MSAPKIRHMHALAFILAVYLLTPDQAWSQGIRGNRGAGRSFSGFARSGATSAVRPRLGRLDGSLTGHRVFIPNSGVGGAHFGRPPFVRFILPGRVVAKRFYPPFIYYHPYPYAPWFGPYAYRSYHPGVSIIEVPSSSESWTTSIVPGFPAENFAPAPLLERPYVRTLPEQLAPFDPTPYEVVDRMLALAGIKAGDLLYDLGSGDGRVLIAAAKKYRIKAVGFEVDPGLVKMARENIKQENLEQLVEVRQQDFMTADLSSASVVTLYLSHDGNEALKPVLLRQLQPGARVVSYTFNMGDWPPKINESYRDGAGDVHTLYYWEIPQSVAYQ